jgi:hypothetical protein
VPRSWRLELAVAALAIAAAQGFPARVEYTVQIVTAGSMGRRVVAGGRVSGPIETGLRLALRSDSSDIEALFSLDPGPDSTVTLRGDFVTQRRLARSRRGLPLWEQDAYRRSAALTWGDTARMFPLGTPRRGAAESLWVEIAVSRRPAGALLRPSEDISIAGSTGALTLEAVLRPRRTVVWLTLIRGDTASPPRRLDLLMDAPPRVLELPVGARERRRLAFALTRPEPPRSERARMLALDADMVCLKVGAPDAAGTARAACGRLNNVAQRLELEGGDTLVANFVWPAAR